jgi:CO/xanthine dehydrogenase Mo-binding subunit
VANRVPVHSTGPYFVPHLRALTRAVYTNNSVAGAFRGFGVPQAHIVTEALLDELAEKTGIDRLQFRLKNAICAGQPTATGQILAASVGMRQCLDVLQPIPKHRAAKNIRIFDVAWALPACGMASAIL